MGRGKERGVSDDTVLVVGLGLFGSATARALTLLASWGPDEAVDRSTRPGAHEPHGS